MVKVEDLMRFERFAPRGFDSLRISNAKIHHKFSPLGDVSLRVCEHVGASLFVV